MTPPPLFLALDGIDGTGKSTQCRLLAAWLRGAGQAVTECADPGTTKVGREIRQVLLHSAGEQDALCEMFLFMAARAQLTSEVIRPALTAGGAVVCDRYLLANVVYQGHAGGLDPDLIWSIGRTATGGLEPDWTIVLDVPLAVAATRRKKTSDRMESKGLDYHERVRQGFLTEAARRPDRVIVVDACGGIEEVHAEIRKCVQERIGIR